MTGPLGPPPRCGPPCGPRPTGRLGPPPGATAPGGPGIGGIDPVGPPPRTGLPGPGRPPGPTGPVTRPPARAAPFKVDPAAPGGPPPGIPVPVGPPPGTRAPVGPPPGIRGPVGPPAGDRLPVGPPPGARAPVGPPPGTLVGPTARTAPVVRSAGAAWPTVGSCDVGSLTARLPESPGSEPRRSVRSPRPPRVGRPRMRSSESRRPPNVERVSPALPVAAGSAMPGAPDTGPAVGGPAVGERGGEPRRPPKPRRSRPGFSASLVRARPAESSPLELVTPSPRPLGSIVGCSPVPPNRRRGPPLAGDAPRCRRASPTRAPPNRATPARKPPKPRGSGVAAVSPMDDTSLSMSRDAGVPPAPPPPAEGASARERRSGRPSRAGWLGSPGGPPALASDARGTRNPANRPDRSGGRSGARWLDVAAPCRPVSDRRSGSSSGPLCRGPGTAPAPAELTGRLSVRSPAGRSPIGRGASSLTNSLVMGGGGTGSP